MTTERFLVTGGLGCLGAWTVKRLLDEGAGVYTYDLSTNPYRLRLVLDDKALARVNVIQGDVTDLDGLETVVRENRITHVIHLAALQAPYVKADPVLGAKVNVVGTTAVLEMALRLRSQLDGVVYASSGSVYGADQMSVTRLQGSEAPHNPSWLYGVFKLANEGTARIYWQDYGLAAVGVRPCGIIYGPGRDRGFSSSPSKAMVAATIGSDYHITFDATGVFEYAKDVAAIFVRAARANAKGAPVCNLGGTAGSTSEIRSLIQALLPSSAAKLSLSDLRIVTPTDFDEQAIVDLIGPIAWTPLSDGVRESIEIMQSALQLGKLNVQLEEPATGADVAMPLGES